MKIFTFTRITQWSYEFYQVIAQSFEEAVELIGFGAHQSYLFDLCSEFPCEETKKSVVIDLDYENKSYEG